MSIFIGCLMGFFAFCALMNIAFYTRKAEIGLVMWNVMLFLATFVSSAWMFMGHCK